MKKLMQIAGACAATAMLAAAAPALAQSTGSNTATDTRTVETRQDNNRDWGWIGLLGLIGLAGLKGRDRHHDDTVRRNTNVPGRA